ncbi:uncharacterized protein LOC129219413 [Uloborus diversus]|uniref:uncharacterized protein LOC129219413 n=1 Tax=Uloborus diversus TaxID=327109 RepID=UPI002409CF3D|nr:uncharacterized protein LOC129219413 [Uloborus diversus]
MTSIQELESDKFQKLTAKRTVLRWLTTQLVNQIEKKLKHVGEIDEAELRDDYELLIARSNGLTALDSEMLEFVELEQIEKEVTLNDEYEAKCLKFSKRILRYLEDKNKGSRNLSSSSNQSTNARINENSRQEVEKFAYLKALLIGQAANVVSGFDLSSENYDNCKEMLKNRFGKRDIIINSFMNKIINLEEVKSSSNVQALRRIHVEIEIAFRNLEAMNVESKSFGLLLMPILQKKLPHDLILQFNKQREDGDIEISELISFLKKEVECREITLAACNENKASTISKGYSNQKNVSKRCDRDIATASALNTSVNQVCIFCQNAYSSYKCNIRTTEKIKQLKTDNRCFKCFKKFHLSRVCNDKSACFKCNGKNHHESICFRNSDERSNSSKSLEQLKTSENTLVASNSNNESVVPNVNANAFVSQNSSNALSAKNVLLQTCTVVICTESDSKTTRAILDQGSERSFIKDTLVKSLNLKPIRTEKLSVFAFGAEKPIVKNYPVVVIELCDRELKNKIRLECLVTDTISSCPVKGPSLRSLEKIQCLGLKPADIVDNVSDLRHLGVLIGADKFWDVVLTARKRINRDLQAVNSIFGWFLVGLDRNTFKQANFSKHSNVSVGNAIVLNDLRIFWELDSMGIIEESSKYSKKDEDLIHRFETELRLVDGRYECKLLWKTTTDGLENNFEVTKRRFETLKQKLDKTPEILAKYKEIIEQQLNENIVEKCANEIKDKDYYMPHRAVIRNSETTNVRIVFDASFKSENCKSLNECLEIGPNLNPSVLDIILRYREHEIGFSGDLEKAFLMIGIAKQDRDFLRFLWFGESNEQFKILRMCRTPFGTSISPFILAATIKYHIKKYKIKNPDVFEMLNSSIYVDDLFYGAKTVEDAYKLSVDAVNIFRDAGMNLRKLKSNSNELNALWLRDNIKQDENLSKKSKFLGMNWNPINDSINLELTAVIESVKSKLNDTKRTVLRTVAKIFDPVGFLQPFTVRMKILLQDIWLSGLNWDESLPSALKGKWNNWCSELEFLKNLTFPRKFFSEADYTELSIHIFCDASPRAFGAVAYFRYSNSYGEIKTSFIMAKGRVAPLKTLSLPRCELMGALIGARLAKYLKGIFPNLTENLYCWSDSTIVLHWLRRSPNEWKPFVSNRVAEIQAICSPNQFFYCDSRNNPADMLTRGEQAETMASSPLWRNGHSWLTESEELWPKKIAKFNEGEMSIESRKSRNVLQISANSEPKQSDSSLFDLDEFGTLKKVYRITAWIMRFINNCKPKSEKLCGPIAAEEIMTAEIFWSKTTQMEHFKKEIETLSDGKNIDKNSSLYLLHPEIDENGLLRLKGRIQFADCQESAKHPLILPSKCRYVELLIMDAHERVFHSGVDATLTHLREKLWIIKARQRIKTVLHKCLICKRFNARPGAQVVAPLPADRIIESPPFAVTGLDYAGPFYCRENNEKHYLLLFTCAVTRAIHLELVPSMNTESLLLAFRRFISRRGLCNTIYSDNAKAFKRADIELKKVFKCIGHPSVQDLFSHYNINWKYIVERGAWWGGFWERMVRTIKTSLRKIVGRSSLSLNELETVFIEIEATINSRPITYVYDDPSEPSPLTPAHFLVGCKEPDALVVKIDLGLETKKE